MNSEQYELVIELLLDKIARLEHHAVSGGSAKPKPESNVPKKRNDKGQLEAHKK